LARTRVWRKGVLEAEDFPVERVSDYLAQEDTVVWADLNVPDGDDLRQMAEELGLSTLAVEDAVESHERPKIDRYPTHLFLTTYAMRFTPEQQVLLAKISAFVLPQALVTVHGGDFDMDPVVKAWDDAPSMFDFGGRGVLYGLLDVIVDGHLACLQQLDEQIEDAEDRLFDEPPRTGNDIQRQTYSLRDVIATMFETGLSLADARLNQIVRKLSGWAAIIAVPTAVTGFYGQNLPYPGYQQWWGFLVSTAVIVVLAVGIWYLFRRRGWL
jgi:magnesium transporter